MFNYIVLVQLIEIEVAGLGIRRDEGDGFATDLVGEVGADIKAEFEGCGENGEVDVFTVTGEESMVCKSIL